MTTDQFNPFEDPSIPDLAADRFNPFTELNRSVEARKAKTAPVAEPLHPLARILHESSHGVTEYASGQIASAVRRMIREELRDVFTEIAERARTENQWEYDSVTSGALVQIGSMAEHAAQRLERRLADDQS